MGQNTDVHSLMFNYIQFGSRVMTVHAIKSQHQAGILGFALQSKFRGVDKVPTASTEPWQISRLVDAPKGLSTLQTFWVLPY